MRLRRIAAPKVVVDVGAYIGLYSIAFSLACPAAKIIALEPSSANYALLRKNIASFENIVTKQVAVWREDGQVEVGMRDDYIDSGFTAIGGKHNKETVNAVKLDRVAPKIDYVKVDVEGSAIEVIRGAMRVLNEDRPTFQISFHEEERQMRNIFRAAQYQLGYTILGEDIFIPWSNG